MSSNFNVALTAAICTLASASATSSEPIYNVTIIGGGMSGLTTAIYAGQEKLAPLVIMGNNKEAQLPLIQKITNFVGQSNGIAGQQLLDDMSQQAIKFGASIVQEHVLKVDFSSSPFKIFLADGKTVLSKTVVVATGTFLKPLGVPGEAELVGKGVFSTAIKDAPHCHNKHIIVVGGGNSAMGEALELAKVANTVTVIYEKAIYASPSIVEKARDTGKVQFIENAQILEISGKDQITGVVYQNLSSQTTETLPTEGLFVSNGRPVNTDLFKGTLEMDEDGVIKICSGKTGTSLSGVFAVGDCRRPLKYRKLLAAAGDGTEAAIDVKEFLATLNKTP